ncbi:MAG: helix-turn-helix domain-containing protein [Acidiphilium sp.]
MAQKPQKLHPEHIKAELRLKYGSLKVVGRLLKLSDKTVSCAILEPGRSFRTEARIAELLGRTAPSLWPERYFPDGKPRYRTFRRDARRDAA